jgi:hypothetical protein
VLWNKISHISNLSTTNPTQSAIRLRPGLRDDMICRWINTASSRSVTHTRLSVLWLLCSPGSLGRAVKVPVAMHAAMSRFPPNGNRDKTQKAADTPATSAAYLVLATLHQTHQQLTERVSSVSTVTKLRAVSEPALESDRCTYYSREQPALPCGLKWSSYGADYSLPSRGDAKLISNYPRIVLTSTRQVLA